MQMSLMYYLAFILITLHILKIIKKIRYLQDSTVRYSVLSHSLKGTINKIHVEKELNGKI